MKTPLKLIVNPKSKYDLKMEQQRIEAANYEEYIWRKKAQDAIERIQLQINKEFYNNKFIFELIIEEVNSIFETDFCFIMEYDKNQLRNRNYYYKGFSKNTKTFEEDTIQKNLPLLFQAIENKEMVWSDKIKDSNLTKEIQVASFLNSPIIFEGQVYGIISLNYAKPKLWKKHEIEFIRNITNLSNIAVLGQKIISLGKEIKLQEKIKNNFSKRSVNPLFSIFEALFDEFYEIDIDKEKMNEMIIEISKVVNKYI
jgi:transcriptional regulator with GAF, ATPase, and Fis domain